MQRITVLCVGKLKEKFYADAAAEYIKRLSRYCKLDVVELPETRLPEDPSPAEIQKALAAEANAIRQKLEAGAVVAMCIEGKTCSSEALSKKLADFALEVFDRRQLRSGRNAEEAGRLAAEHVAYDVPAPSGAGDAAGADLSGVSDRGGHALS